MPPLRTNEDTLLKNCLELALILGWRRAHFRAARTKYGYRTPVQGDGKGFPDLILVHPRHGVLWREVKGDGGRLGAEQEEWGEALLEAGQDWRVWTPAHWPGQIQAELRGDA